MEQNTKDNTNNKDIQLDDILTVYLVNITQKELHIKSV